ncbi:MAG: AAA family ATPase [Proteobacteria bacterium]|nr:AAA family ATPase [Pseudomonadota bacterium]
MKIIGLRFKNLNSLKGEFKIDFDRDSILGQAGIFAITGSIGAGKTTILDAISVALYGRTPRLESGDSSELMTRHTGDCYAEVEFSVKNRHYRSKWSRRRARGKADGRFQPTAMELAELQADSEKIIEEQKKRVPSKVMELTGLDYRRFTRSVLLAQGDFAAFLNAKDDERADLLEKMTGTEIYSLISQETHLKATEEKQKLSDLKLVIESIKLMEPEELEDEKEKSQEIAEKINNTSLLVKQIEEWKKWQQTIAELEKTIQTSSSELEEIAMDKEARTSDLERLTKGIKALPLKSKFDVLETRYKQIAGYEKEIDTLKKEIPDLEKTWKSHDHYKKEVEQSFDLFKQKSEKEIERIDQTVQKDQLIKKDQASLKERKKIQNAIQTELKELEKKKRETDDDISKTNKEIEKCRLFLEQHSIDASLEKNLPVIEDRLKRFTRMISTKSEKREQQKRNLETVAKSIEKYDQVNRKFASLTEQIQAKSKDNAGLEKHLNQELDNKTLDERELDEKKLSRQCDEAEKLIELGKRMAEIQSKNKEIQAKRTQALEKRKNEQKHQGEVSERLKTEETIQEQLEKKRELELLVTKYEDDRKKLKPGEACPLCGSKDHPWFEGLEMEIDRTVEALSNQKQKLSSTRRALEKSAAQIAELDTTVDQCNSTVREYKEELQELVDKWKETTARMNIAVDPDAWRSVEKLQQDWITDLKKQQQRIVEIKTLKTSVDRLNREIVEAEKRLANLKLDRQQAENQKKQADSEGTRLQQEIEALIAESEELEKTLMEELKQYRESLGEPGSEMNLLRRLKKRSKKFLDTTRNLQNLEKQSTPLRERKIAFENQIKKNAERHEEESENVRKIETVLDNLKKERKELLGDQDPNTARKALKEQQADLENKMADSGRQLTKTASDLNAKGELLKRNQKEYAELSATVQQEKIDFQIKLGEIGFTNKIQFRKALLSTEEQKELETLQSRLQTRETQARTRLEDAQKRLKIETEKEVTKDDLKTILEKESEQKTVLEKLQLEMGAVRESLRQQELLRKEQKEQLDKIALQETEYKRWDALHKLIGAADGKKFKTFAQGLTLDYLISLANGNLDKLNERYYLVRSRIEELGLEVVDTYQADVKRPTNTLSGGETFLASLALALGLSSLASRQTTIDSLFLDEGFGTLDTESLETALAALDNLNASGKTIGIISHIEALKERIPTQIQVHKLSGGISTLEIVS